MHHQANSNRTSKKRWYIAGAAFIILAIGLFIWQQKKYKVVRQTVKSTLAKGTDSLYSIKYDSLFLDELAGLATIENIRITPDTQRIKNLPIDEQPDVVIDVVISSIKVSGVQTADALLGKQLIGDSVNINHPNITIYNLKPFRKDTKIKYQAEELYKQILGKMNLLKVNTVLVNNVNVKGVDFYSGQNNYKVVNGNIQLIDVAVDSISNLDTTRTLFARKMAFTVDSFFTFNHNRKELMVNKVAFSGEYNTLLFDRILMNRFTNAQSQGITLLDAHLLKLSGINSNEIVKNKNLVIDTILCKQITYYEAPLVTKSNNKPLAVNDSSGFMNVYSAELKHLEFGDVKMVSNEKSKFEVGKISLKVNSVKTNQLASLMIAPSKFVKEFEMGVSSLNLSSKDKKYQYKFNDILLNSLKKELRIAHFSILPYRNESQFANNESFQQDRYDVQLSGINLRGISMDDLLSEKIIANELVVSNTSAKIYRDLRKPLKKVSKVGNYPSQMLQKLEIPVNIQKVTLENAFIQYKEMEVASDSAGVVNFNNAKLVITNVTNMPELIKKDPALNIAFNAKALSVIPLKGNFKFFMHNNEGNFEVNGSTTSFNALSLNKVSIPMALIRINSGNISSLEFHLTGNNTSAKGSFVMKYQDLKVDVLKINKETGDLKKKGLVTFAANTLVKNNNPQNGKLREANPEFQRDIYKSFFNLIWKTIFTGMKSTLGIPNI